MSHARTLDFSLPFLLPLAAVVAMNAACGQRSRNNAPPAGEQQKVDGTVIKDFSGEWTPDPAGDNQLTPDPTKIYTLGCANPGEKEHKAAIDARLNQVEQIEILSKYQDHKLGFLDEEYIETPKTISAEELRLSRSQFKTLRASESMKPLSADDEIDIRCALEAGASDLNCLAFVVPKGATQKKPAEYSLSSAVTCQLTPASEESETVQFENGTFTLAKSQKKVVGLKRTTTQRGEVTCMDEAGVAVLKGEGEKVTVEILSNEVPSRMSAQFCGGSLVYSKVALHAGAELLSETSSEVLDVKEKAEATN
jgi:hypothetical protein